MKIKLQCWTLTFSSSCISSFRWWVHWPLSHVRHPCVSHSLYHSIICSSIRKSSLRTCHISGTGLCWTCSWEWDTYGSSPCGGPWDRSFRHNEMRTVAWGIEGANSHLLLCTKCSWFCLLNTSQSQCLLLIQSTLVFLQACLHDLGCFLTGLLVPISHATSLASLKSFSHPAARKTIQKQNTSSCNFLVYNILSPIVFNKPEDYNMLLPEEGLQWLITGVGPLPNSDGESLCSSNSLPGHNMSFIKWPLLTSSISPPWLLPCAQRMDFLSPVSPHLHSLLNTSWACFPRQTHWQTSFKNSPVLCCQVAELRPH